MLSKVQSPPNEGEDWANGSVTTASMTDNLIFYAILLFCESQRDKGSVCNEIDWGCRSGRGSGSNPKRNVAEPERVGVI